MARKALTLTLWAAVIAGAVGVMLLKAARPMPPPDAPGLPVLFTAPTFSLVDQNAKTFTDGDLRGKVWIADFIYTHCAGPCPTMTLKLVEMQKKLAPLGVRFVSFTVDPAADTPAQLKAYAHQFGGDESSWSLLSGNEQQMIDVAKGMNLTMFPATLTTSIAHDIHFALVDAQGRVRGMYNSIQDDRMEQLKVDAAALAAGKAP